MQAFTTKHIDTYFDYKEFIDFLQRFYGENITTPIRQHIDLGKNPNGTMLLMPSWSDEEFMGVKLVNVFPGNKKQATINGLYVLMSRKTGEVLAHFDALPLTCRRTAAVSALAGKLLTDREMNEMLMLGTGNMSLELIRAHHAIHDFSSIKIWGRSFEKAQAKAVLLQAEGYPVEAIKDKDACANVADLISIATLSEEALLFGNTLQDDVYIDLVGSYQRHTREADDAVLRGAKIYVDTYNAIEESGELRMPLESGVIKRDNILADLTELSVGSYKHDDHGAGKIVFKSVGFAASDLACGVYLYEKGKLD